MATYKTEGIVLKRTNLGEADRILTIFTKKRGKIKTIAKGVRKTLSKLAGHIELFCLTDFVIAEGRNLDTICGAETIKCFFKLRNNLPATHAAYYLAEIINEMTAENEAHPEIFVLLNDILEHLDSGQKKLLVSYFEINFLAEAGYRPELYKCLTCHKNIKLGENFLNFEIGGLVCGKCHQGDIKVSEDGIKVLRLFLKHRISVIQRIQTNPKLAQEVEKLSSDYLRYVSQKEFKSKRFLKILDDIR